MKISNINYLDIVKILLFTILIFFWDLKIKVFDTRLLLFLLLFLFLFDYKNLRLDKYKKFLIYFSLFFLFVSGHYYLNLFQDAENLYHIPKNLIYIFFLILVILFNLEFLRNNLRWIIFLFIFTYVISTIIYFIINGYNQEFALSCSFRGGWQGHTKFLFAENSHFSMMSVATIIFYLVGIDLKKNSTVENIFIFIFTIMALINFSGVTILSIMLCLIALLISNYKYYTKQSFLFTFLLLSFAIFFLITDKECNYKIIKTQVALIKPILEKYKKFEILNNYFQKYIDRTQILTDTRLLVPEHDKERLRIDVESNIIDNFMEAYEEEKVPGQTFPDWMNSKDENYLININLLPDGRLKEGGGPILLERAKEVMKIKSQLTSRDRRIIDLLLSRSQINISNIKLGMSGAVVLNSINISKASLLHRPLGWGLDRYHSAYKEYVGDIKKYNLKNYHFRLFHWNLNSVDGSNNLAKLVTEFGLFSFLLFIFFIYFSFSKKATLQEKSFLIPLILTQLLRGAGYYNGGFFICIILMLAISLSRSND